MDTQRVIDDLRELARRTGGPDGARRVCWTDEWLKARELLRDRLGELPVDVSIDQAGNLWADLPGRADRFVIVGSHVDSVPAGGWLDGALGVFSALETLRDAAAADGPPPIGLRLVDWADEEGARFGRSLFGSSAAAGTLDPAEVRDLRDGGGRRLADVLAEHDVNIDEANAAGERLRGACAYLELHIEQGPVLESERLPAGTVLGTCGVERHRVTFTGQTAHAGSTPMLHRRDAFAAAARAALEIREIGIRHDGVCTVGAATCEPGIVTAIAGRCEILLDQRHIEADTLATMLAEAREACSKAADEFGCTVELQYLWSIPPIPFDERLIAEARGAVAQAGGTDRALPSGPLHDAAEMARLMPTVMLFSSSSPPISHTKEEDTPEADLRVAIAAYGQTVRAALQMAADGELEPRS